MRRPSLTFPATFAACFVVTAASAQPMTSDLVSFVGGNFISIQIEGEAAVRLGLVSWTAREASALPLPMTLTGRGLHQILFFDPAPLLDVDQATDEASLRTALGLSASEALPADDPPALPAPVAAFRRLVRAQMRAFKLNSLPEVVAIAVCQRQVNDHAGSASDVVYRLLACGRSLPNDAPRDAHAILRFVRGNGLLTPVLRTAAASVDRRHVAAYVIETRKDEPVGAADEVHAAAAGAKEETVVTLAFPEPKTFLQGDGARLFLPPVFTLLSIVVTAWIGFQVFQAQQRIQFKYFGRQQRAQFKAYLRQQQYQEERAAADRFQQRKYEKFTQLDDFFRNTYPAFGNSDLVTPEDIRGRLVGANVYSMLPADAAAELNAICEGSLDRAEAVRQIDSLLKKQFGEFMRTRP